MSRSSTSFKPGQSGSPSTQFTSSNQPGLDRSLPRTSLKSAIDAISDHTDWDKLNLDIETRRVFIDRFGNNGQKAIAYKTFEKALQGDLRAVKIIQKILG